MFERATRYETGSKVQDQKGYIRIKRAEGGWTSEHRLIAAEFGDATGKTGDLEENERVFHLNGKSYDNDPKNLVRITYNTKPFRLVHSRVLFRPISGQKALSRAQTLLQAAWDGAERRKKGIRAFIHKERRKAAIAA